MDYGNFSFHMDAEIVFGKDTETEAGRLVKKYGGTKVMIVYGSGSIVRSGLYGRVAKSLTEAGIPFVEFGGVQPNPKRSYGFSPPVFPTALIARRGTPPNAGEPASVYCS